MIGEPLENVMQRTTKSMSSAERLARDLMIGMKEIDPSKGGRHYEAPG